MIYQGHNAPNSDKNISRSEAEIVFDVTKLLPNCYQIE